MAAPIAANQNAMSWPKIILTVLAFELIRRLADLLGRVKPQYDVADVHDEGQDQHPPEQLTVWEAKKLKLAKGQRAQGGDDGGDVQPQRAALVPNLHFFQPFILRQIMATR